MARSLRQTCIVATAAFAATGSIAYAAEAHYDCSGGVELNAQFSAPGAAPGHVVLTFAGSAQKTTLPQVPSADGGRYANEAIEFWIKGRSATLSRGGGTETCTAR